MEQEGHLGGHTSTFTDPVSGEAVDYGAQNFAVNSIVADYFQHLGIQGIERDPFFSARRQKIDIEAGKLLGDFQKDYNMTRYINLLDRYPYLDLGFHLPNPLPEDLLLPFGGFLDKFNLGTAAERVTSFAIDIGDYLTYPALY